MKKHYIVISLTLLFGVIVGRYMKPTDIISTTHAMDIEKRESLDEFTVPNVIAYMKQLNIKYIEFSFAQTQKETGHFTSNIFKENFNIFGMKLSYQRPTPTKEENRNHAKYNNWKESVIDFAILQARILAIVKNDKKKYMEYINQYYSDNRNYVMEVNQIVEDNRKKNIF